MTDDMNKYFNLISMVLFFLLITGCTPNTEKEILLMESIIGFDLGEFEIIENEEDVSFNDYLRSLLLEFDEKDYQRIVDQAKKADWYDGITQFNGVNGRFIICDTTLSDGDKISIVFYLDKNELKYSRSGE